MGIKLIALTLITNDDNLPLCWDTTKFNNMTTTYLLLEHNQSQKHHNNIPAPGTQPNSTT